MSTPAHRTSDADPSAGVPVTRARKICSHVDGGPWSPPACLGTDRRTYHRVLHQDPCSYCSRQQSGTVDHVEPHSRGGRSASENLTGACTLCNSEKGALPLLLFLLGRREAEEAERGVVTA